MVSLIWDILEAVRTALEGWSSLNVIIDVVAFFNNDISITFLGTSWDLFESPLDIVLSPTIWIFFITLGFIKTFIPAA